jgi:hypothetical protein
MKYLVDSDWIIDALVGVPAAVNTLIQLNPDGLAVSIIAIGKPAICECGLNVTTMQLESLGKSSSIRTGDA